MPSKCLHRELLFCRFWGWARARPISLYFFQIVWLILNLHIRSTDLWHVRYRLKRRLLCCYHHLIIIFIIYPLRKLHHYFLLLQFHGLVIAQPLPLNILLANEHAIIVGTHRPYLATVFCFLFLSVVVVAELLVLWWVGNVIFVIVVVVNCLFLLVAAIRDYRTLQIRDMALADRNET